MCCVAFVITGCVNTQDLPMPTSATIPSDMARIQLDRISGFVGGGRSPSIRDNGVKIGDIGNGGTLIWERPEGESCLTDWVDQKLCFYAKGGKLTKVKYQAMEGFSLESFDAARKPTNIVDINK